MRRAKVYTFAAIEDRLNCIGKRFIRLIDKP